LVVSPIHPPVGDIKVLSVSSNDADPQPQKPLSAQEGEERYAAKNPGLQQQHATLCTTAAVVGSRVAIAWGRGGRRGRSNKVTAAEHGGSHTVAVAAPPRCHRMRSWLTGKVRHFAPLPGSMRATAAFRRWEDAAPRRGRPRGHDHTAARRCLGGGGVIGAAFRSDVALRRGQGAGASPRAHHVSGVFGASPSRGGEQFRRQR
jgi:hypothetical protein